MSLAIPPDLALLIRSKVEGGKFASEGDVIREALRLLEERERDAARLEQLGRDIQLAVDQVARGQVVPLDMDMIREKARARREGRGAAG